MRKKFLAVLLLVMLVCTSIPAIPAADGAADSAKDLHAALSSYRVENSLSLADDGVIGIPVQLDLYYKHAAGSVVPGFNGTPVILYVIGTNTERIGTDSDTEILLPLLEKGYVIAVLDYKNHDSAAGQPLDFSVQAIRSRLKTGEFFTDSVFPKGEYPENHVVPAGYTVSLGHVFWEMDKHAADGTLEWIVDNWNTDFRGIKGEKNVKWVNADGTRKATLERAADGSAPVWYNAAGQRDDANGQYTKVKYTVAKSVTDCVNPDGSPISLDVKMNLVYPSSPGQEVPVMVLANSSDNLAVGTQAADRPHMNGFLFRGYAGVVYDYAYVPMAHDESYGVYNGSKSTYKNAVTNDSDNYGAYMYNNHRVDTAAMRYIRYLAYSQSDIYRFAQDRIGVYGNSKGGAMSFLGEAVLQKPLADAASYSDTDSLEEALDRAINAFTSRRAFANHHGETRYQNGITESYTANGVTVDGGERQPWLTFNGKEILSGAQMIYASNGVCEEDISAGHVPQFIANHKGDAWHYYGPIGHMANICHALDIPSLVLEVPLGHTMASGPDMCFGIDTYDALMDFAGYHLKNEPVKVMYTDITDGGADMSCAAFVTLKFSGSVSETEIRRVTLRDASGKAAGGVWSSAYGRTEWTFTADLLRAGETYTLTIPAGFAGENGVLTKTAFEKTLYTAAGDGRAVSDTVKSADGIRFTADASDLGGEDDRLYIRFRAENDAANTALLCAAGADGKAGECIAEIPLRGAGWYEADVSEYLRARGGKAEFILKAAKKAGDSAVYTSDFKRGTAGVSASGAIVLTAENAPDGTPSLKIVRTDSGSQYGGGHVIYNNRSNSNTLRVQNILGTSTNESDTGRRFTITVRMYDTVSRQLSLQLSSNTSSADAVMDYDHTIYNVHTKAGTWTEFAIPYTLYDADYGNTDSVNKHLMLSFSHTGDLKLPVYIGSLTVTEHVTALETDGVYLCSVSAGDAPYKAPAAEMPLAVCGGDGQILGTYAAWNEAIAACTAGQSIRLLRDYTLRDDALWTDALPKELRVDLDGYTIRCANTRGALLRLKADGITVHVENGQILLKNTPLVDYDRYDDADGSPLRIELKKVTLSADAGADTSEFISASAIPRGADVRIRLTDCILRVSDSALTHRDLLLLPASSDGGTLHYEMAGGTIRLDSLRWVTVLNQLRSCTFSAGENGAYTALLLPASVSADGFSWMRDDGVAQLRAAAEERGLTRFEPLADPLSTRYGIVPAEYADAQAYPFVWFDETGAFRGAAPQLYGNTDLSSAVGAARTYMKDNVYKSGSYGENPKAAFIVMRRDYSLASNETFGNLAQVQGTLTLDLGGFTLTANKKPLTDSCSKGWNYSGDAVMYPTGIVMENGSIALNGNSLLHFHIWDSAGDGSVKDKTFTHEYRNITFRLGRGTDALFTYARNANTPKAASSSSVIFTDCTFDLTESASVSLFRLPTPDNGRDPYLTLDVTVGGVTVITPAMQNVTLTNAPADLRFTDSESGYLTVACDAGAQDALPQDFFTTPAGRMRLAPAVAEDGKTVFTLAHRGGAADCRGAAVCEDCGEPYGEPAPHVWQSEYVSDEAEHWSACSVCGVEAERAPHAFGEWRTDGLKRIRMCVCGAENSEADTGRIAVLASAAAFALAAAAAVSVWLIRRRKS